MADAPKIAIIGAGIAGLACARGLSKAGVASVVFDKGRGVGGRVATRRAEAGRQFDHGAQFITAQGGAFDAVLIEARAAGAVAEWDDGSQEPRYVGVPGMSGFAKHLARGLELRQRTEVVGLLKERGGWLVRTAGGESFFDRVVSTVPAPQTVALLGGLDDLAGDLSRVAFEPCLTLMFSLAPRAARPVLDARDREPPHWWIAQESTKPRRPGSACWVAQASPAWSAQHLELELSEVRARMLDLLCPRLGVSHDHIDYAAAHRWRYARVAHPLGRDFARDSTRTFYAGGDWCLGPRVEAAWISGDAIARDLLETL